MSRPLGSRRRVPLRWSASVSTIAFNACSSFCVRGTREDLKTRTQRPAFARGVAEADDLRSLAVVPCAFEKLLFGSAAADGARDAQLRHYRHRPGDARHRARVIHDLDQHGAVTRAKRLKRMHPRVRADFSAVFHSGIVTECPISKDVHRCRDRSLPADHADHADSSHPANHRGTEKAQSRPPSSQPRRHEEHKGAKPASARLPGVTRRTCRRSDDRRPSGEKPDRSGCEHPSRSGFPPADAQGASVPPYSYLLERESLINVRGEACALRERGPVGRDAATSACVRGSGSTQRSLAARRPGPRRTIE